MGFIEAESVEDIQDPVHICHRYLNNRIHQLDYKSAIGKGLPIGSGEIESAHRYVIQKRLKLSGAWRKASNIMLIQCFHCGLLEKTMIYIGVI